MAYRDLTQKFLRYVLKDQEEETEIKQEVTITIPQSNKYEKLPETPKDFIPLHDELPPQWADLLDDIDRDINQAEKYTNSLKVLHTKQLRVTFDDTTQQDLQIQELTRTITKTIKDAQSKLKRIGTIGNEENKKKMLPYAERLLRLNVMRSRGMKIQQVSKKFKKLQKKYVEKLSEQASWENSNETDTTWISKGIEEGFTQSQLEELDNLEKDTDLRTKSIIKIAKDVNELFELFQELSLLIVEQGSLLDRIDYNVEQAVNSIEKADKNIIIADRYQKGNRSCLCIFVLILLVILAAFILIILNIAN